MFLLRVSFISVAMIDVFDGEWVGPAAGGVCGQGEAAVEAGFIEEVLVVWSRVRHSQLA